MYPFDALIGIVHGLADLPPTSAAYVKLWNALEDIVRDFPQDEKDRVRALAEMEALHDLRANILICMLES